MNDETDKTDLERWRERIFAEPDPIPEVLLVVNDKQYLMRNVRVKTSFTPPDELGNEMVTLSYVHGEEADRDPARTVTDDLEPRELTDSGSFKSLDVSKIAAFEDEAGGFDADPNADTPVTGSRFDDSTRSSFKPDG